VASILFDLDGTLTDAREGIERCFRYALRSVGVTVPSDSDLTRFIGPPLRESLSQLLGDPGEERIDEALRCFRERFEAKGMYENKVYPGIVEMLNQIAGMRWRAYVVTSKAAVFARRIVSHFQLMNFFTGVYGSELDGRLAKKGELIRHVMDEECIPAGQAIVVGDRSEDVRGARVNGLDSIGVTYGYGSRRELESAGATWICDSPASVLEVLRTRFGDSCGIL
jgi:phosphoglycolate phosphatase